MSNEISTQNLIGGIEKLMSVIAVNNTIPDPKLYLDLLSSVLEKIVKLEVENNRKGKIIKGFEAMVELENGTITK